MKNFKLYTRWLIFNEKNQVLLVQKNDKQKIAPWKNLFPWWSIEYKETPEQALKREIMEEVWLEVIDLELFDTKTMILWETHWLWVYYICKVKNLNFKNMEPEKHKKVFWWGIWELEKQTKEVLEKYILINNKKK